LEFTFHSHRSAEEKLSGNPALATLWTNLKDILNSISEEDLINDFTSMNRQAKSISESVNRLIDDRLVKAGWSRQSRIFKDDGTYNGKTWTLDFSKKVEDDVSNKTGIAIEVVFNHAEAVAWNLMKLRIASEMNHVRKETDIGNGVGVFICATDDLIKKGGYDGAVGSYERVLKYLAPLNEVLISPLIVVGLKPPKSFQIEHYRHPENPKKTLGRIKKT
jgi:hypothetical protein